MLYCMILYEIIFKSGPDWMGKARLEENGPTT